MTLSSARLKWPAHDSARERVNHKRGIDLAGERVSLATQLRVNLPHPVSTEMLRVHATALAQCHLVLHRSTQLVNLAP